MILESLNQLEKRLRTEVIKNYMDEERYAKAVCFTCGNAGKRLRDAGIETLTIGPGQDLTPNRWFTREEIAGMFPQHFNATSGQLPMTLYYRIARRLVTVLGPGGKPGSYRFPIAIGSGETALVYAYAYPERIQDVELYRDGTPATEYHEEADLNEDILRIYGTLAIPSELK